MKIFTVNAFIRSTEQGNPAAVVVDFTGSENEMQDFAATLNMPATVFILPTKDNNCDVY